jgi:AcrR family transcriptional regulator
MTTSHGTQYHHGDLREALLRAAEDLVRRHGVNQVSLRAIARAAGVSHAAPYHHFADLDDLLAHAAASGFVRLREAMLEPHSPDAATPIERLQRAGISYVRFAAENPELYRLMFSDRLRDVREHPELASASAAAYRALGELLTPPGGNAPKVEAASDPSPQARAAWATVHGLAMLLIDGRLDVDPEQTEQVEAVAREVTDVLGPGLREG